MLQKFAMVAAISCLVLGVLTFVGGLAINAWFATEVIEVREFHDEATRAVMRQDYAQRIERGDITPAQVAEIYGPVIDREPVRYVFVDENRLLTPAEMPDLRLYAVDRAANQDPWDTGRVQLFTIVVAIGLVLAGFALLYVRGLVRRLSGSDRAA